MLMTHYSTLNFAGILFTKDGKWILIGAILVLAILGTLVFTASRRGWMRNGYFTIFSTLLIVIGVFLCFQSFGALLTLIANGGKLEGASGVATLAMNGIAQLVVMLGGTVFLSRAAGQNPFAVFRLEGFHETPVFAYVLSVPIILSAQAVGVAISAFWTRIFEYFPYFYNIINKFESAGDEQLQGMVTAHGTIEFVLILLFVAIIPAFAEETLFRGFAQSNIERSGHRHHARPMIALVVASLFFASIHLSLFKLPGLLALGLALGWMTYRTNNLFVGSLGHAANNGIIVIALYLNPETAKGSTNSTLVGNTNLSSTEALTTLAVFVPILALLLYLFARSTEHCMARFNSERELSEPFDKLRAGT
jgi:membrane protease YdiL (CAAX protease family)